MTKFCYAKSFVFCLLALSYWLSREDPYSVIFLFLIALGYIGFRKILKPWMIKYFGGEE